MPRAYNGEAIVCRAYVAFGHIGPHLKVRHVAFGHMPCYFRLVYMRASPKDWPELVTLQLDYTKYAQWPLATGLIGIRGNPSGCPYSPSFYLFHW